MQDTQKKAIAIVALASSLAFALAACSAGSAPFSPNSSALPLAPGLTNATRQQAIDSGRRSKHQLLFVSDTPHNVISVYDLDGKRQNPPPLYTITQGISGPRGIAVDNKGNLYVANSTGNTITAYAPSGTTPIFTLSFLVIDPVDVKVDGAGNVYVAGNPLYGQKAYIEEYPAGSTAPSRGWSVPSTQMQLSGIALLDPNNPSQTSVYALEFTTNGSGVATGDALSCYPGQDVCTELGYAFGQTGGIAVAQSPGPSLPFQFLAVDRYVPGVDIFTLNQPMQQLVTGGSPQGLTLNAKGTRLLVADQFYRRVIEYTYPGEKQLNTFDGGAQADGVATFPSGSLR